MTRDVPPPSLSVVIAATDSPEAIDRSLQALEGQGAGRIEVIVVAAEAPRSTPDPPVLWITAPPGSGVPRLRRLGLEASRGRVVAFLEDSCLVLNGWAEAWLSAFEDPALVAASGVVEHADEASTLDWAVVFCEYAPFLPPIPKGASNRLAGNNFAVLRETALRASDDEVHETALLAVFCRVRCADRGLRFGMSGDGPHSGPDKTLGRTCIRSVEAARVRHVRRFGWREALTDRFRFGFEFGRLRTIGASPIIRWSGLVAGPAIFASQVGRLSRTILRNHRYPGRFVGALPITLALLASWSLGEWLGWCLGPPNPGRSLARKRRETRGQTPGSRPGRVESPPAGCTPGPPVA